MSPRKVDSSAPSHAAPVFSKAWPIFSAKNQENIFISIKKHFFQKISLYLLRFILNSERAP
jgi:hypothetical protein